jgi:hypothetical protein
VPAEPGYLAILRNDASGVVTIHRIVAWVLRGLLPGKPNVPEGATYQEWDKDRVDEQGDPDPGVVDVVNSRRWETLALGCKTGTAKLVISPEHVDFEWAGHVEDIPSNIATLLDAALGVEWRAQYGRVGP